MYVPKYVQKIANLLNETIIKRISLSFLDPPIEGVRGILTTTNIAANMKRNNLIGRNQEYLFWIPNDFPLEISIQLYMNTLNHWRIFVFTKRGMLFSINLTTQKQTRYLVTIAQTLSIRVQSLSTEERKRNLENLVSCLRDIGLEVNGNNKVVLGQFDGQSGQFLDTSPQSFIRDILVLALVKGHFMTNKQIKLPGLKYSKTAYESKVSPVITVGRSIPLSMRFEVLQRDRSCKLCGMGPTNGVRLHVDHIVPFSQGGRTCLENLQVLCERCNLGKGNRSSMKYD